MRAWALVLWVLLLLGGCTVYRAPSVRVAGAEMVESGASGNLARFVLEVRNDNQVELPARLVEYDVWFDGRHVFSAERSPEATLRRVGTQRIVLPAPAAAGWDGGQESPGGPVRYRIEGRLVYVTPGELADVLFDAQIYRPSVRFQAEGELAAPGAEAPG